MFIENVNIIEGVINGARITVISFSFDEIGVVTMITIQLTNSNITMNLKQNIFLYKYMHEFFYYKAYFPNILAYSITRHKSQGATIITNGFIDIQILSF